MPKPIYTLEGKVTRLEERRITVESHLVGGNRTDTTAIDGWYATIDLGGVEFSFFLGGQKPDLPFLIKIRAIP